MSYHNKDVKEVLVSKQTSLKGLTQLEAYRRLQRFGENKLKEEKRFSILKILLRQFNDAVIYILIFAAAVSFFIGEDLDGYVILAILVFNALLGFIQENKAEKAIALLKKLTTLKARVIRDGVLKEVSSTELVPGDVVVLEAGDKVPADVRIIEANNFQTNEAVLTGESFPCNKQIKALPMLTYLAERSNMLYSGTVVVRGTGKGIVVETGMGTEIGRIAKMVQEAEDQPTHLQKKLKEFGRFLGSLIIGICFIVFILGLFRGMDFVETLLTAISLAVAAVPEGLPAVVTICLALSVQKMVKKNVLVKSLKSIETLGDVTVICSDKTGTLTKNEMTVRRIYVNEKVIDVEGHGYNTEGDFYFNGKKIDPKEFNLLLSIAISCNNASENVGDPTEMALLFAAKKGGAEKIPRTGEVPFEAEKKFMVTMHKGFDYYKGAPEIILEKCSHIIINGKKRRLIDRDRKKILDTNSYMAQDALRVLAMAIKKDGVMYFVGLMGMIDPPKEGVKDAIELCRLAGIRSIIITGDHPLTAQAIGKSIGFEGKVITGTELDKIDDDEMKNVVKVYSIFARASSAHKVKILKALQRNGEIVAMTGDGINDAPALKNANVGVAMSLKGTDVSRDAADIVLTDDHYSSIVAAIEQGRIVYDNIKRFVEFLLSSNAVEIGVISIALLIGWPLPLLPIQILWINLMTDSWPALALGVEKGDKDIMKRKPRDPKEKFMKGMKPFIFITGIIGTVIVLSLFFWELVILNSGEVKARTVALVSLIIFEMFRAYSCKSKKPFGNLFSNRWLHIAVIFSIGLQFIILYTGLSVAFKVVALSLYDWIKIVLFAFVGYCLIEVSKLGILWRESLKQKTYNKNI